MKNTRWENPKIILGGRKKPRDIEPTRVLAAPKGYRIGFASNEDLVEVSHLFKATNFPRRATDFGSQQLNSSELNVVAATRLQDLQGNFWDEGGGFYKLTNGHGEIVVAGGIFACNEFLCEASGLYYKAGLVTDAELIILFEWFSEYILLKAIQYDFVKLKINSNTNTTFFDDVVARTKGLGITNTTLGPDHNRAKTYTLASVLRR